MHQRLKQLELISRLNQASQLELSALNFILYNNANARKIINPEAFINKIYDFFYGDIIDEAWDTDTFGKIDDDAEKYIYILLVIYEKLTGKALEEYNYDTWMSKDEIIINIEDKIYEIVNLKISTWINSLDEKEKQKITNRLSKSKNREVDAVCYLSDIIVDNDFFGSFIEDVINFHSKIPAITYFWLPYPLGISLLAVKGAKIFKDSIYIWNKAIYMRRDRAKAFERGREYFGFYPEDLLKQKHKPNFKKIIPAIIMLIKIRYRLEAESGI